MSRPRSESGPILNWFSPDANSDLGSQNPDSDLGWTIRTRLGPNQTFDLGWPKSKSDLGLDIYVTV